MDSGIETVSTEMFVWVSVLKHFSRIRSQMRWMFCAKQAY